MNDLQALQAIMHKRIADLESENKRLKDALEHETMENHAWDRRRIEQIEALESKLQAAEAENKRLSRENDDMQEASFKLVDSQTIAELKAALQAAEAGGAQIRLLLEEAAKAAFNARAPNPLTPVIVMICQSASRVSTGAALLEELEAGRRVVEIARKENFFINPDGHPEAYPGSVEMADAIEAYDRTVGGAK